MQGLRLLVTALLARERRQPPAVAAGAPHAEFAAELMTLPSGLHAKVCEAIVRLQVRFRCGDCNWFEPSRKARFPTLRRFRDFLSTPSCGTC